MAHMKMYDGELIFDETGVPQPLSEGVGDRVKDQPLHAFDLVITAKDNSTNCSIGGPFVSSGGGTPLRPNEQDRRVLNDISLKGVYGVGTAGEGITFSYKGVVGDPQIMQGVPPGLEGLASTGVLPLFGSPGAGDVQ